MPEQAQLPECGQSLSAQQAAGCKPILAAEQWVCASVVVGVVTTQEQSWPCVSKEQPMRIVVVVPPPLPPPLMSASLARPPSPLPGAD